MARSDERVSIHPIASVLLLAFACLALRTEARTRSEQYGPNGSPRGSCGDIFSVSNERSSCLPAF